MEAYTTVRKRNAVLMGGMNGLFAVMNAATGKLVIAPMIGFFSYQSLRNARRMSNDPTGFHAEWNQVREALADAERRHAAGEGRRHPSPLSMLVFFLIGVSLGAQAKLLLHVSWAAALTAGAVIGVVGIAGDLALHVRHRAPAGARPGAPDVDLVALEAEAPQAIDVPPAGWDGFPIADYDRLTVRQVMPLLPKLYADELPEVVERERAGKARRTVLQRLDQLAALLADAPDDVTAEEWTAARATPVPSTDAVAALAPARRPAARSSISPRGRNRVPHGGRRRPGGVEPRGGPARSRKLHESCCVSDAVC
jgi:hypothetical protein